jgi:hypothetical protein
MRRSAVGEGLRVLFMVVESFTPERARAVYRKLREQGRSLPGDLRYVDSWVRADLRGCYQVMECEDVTVLQEWIAGWGELAEFEIVPVTDSTSAQALMARIDGPGGPS